MERGHVVSRREGVARVEDVVLVAGLDGIVGVLRKGRGHWKDKMVFFEL